MSQQSATWSSTGAAGCEGIVPASVSSRFSFARPAPWGDTAVDAQGNLTTGWAQNAVNPAPGASKVDLRRGFFPADGSAGAVIPYNGGILGARQRGFLVGEVDASTQTERAHAYAPDGTDEGYLGEAFPTRLDSVRQESFWPDPRGGFVQTRITFVEDSTRTWTYAVRWVDDSLQARTDWIAAKTWNYPYNIEERVLVDTSGRVLVLLFFDPPMSMPCPGDLSFNAWVAEDGSVAPLQTATPTYNTDECTGLGGSYGLPVALEDGFAFYYTPGPNAPVAGWWASFHAGETTSEAPPAWLSQYGAPIQRLPSGGIESTLQRLPDGAYTRVIRDSTTCARTVELIGSAGQVCATLPLDDAADCTASDVMWPDGTVSIDTGCSIDWWPGLARPH